MTRPVLVMEAKDITSPIKGVLNKVMKYFWGASYSCYYDKHFRSYIIRQFTI